MPKLPTSHGFCTKSNLKSRIIDISQFCFFQNEAQPLLFATRWSEKAYLKEKRMMPAIMVLSGGTVNLGMKLKNRTFKRGTPNSEERN